jgi:BirA family biotin operon repressor/biotin-[acetyl-CoA-carboxylase] ligase
MGYAKCAALDIVVAISTLWFLGIRLDKHQQYQSLLSLMKSGDFISGSTLCQHLGCTRTVVHRRVNELKSYGVPINAIAGRGYRLVHHDIILPDLQAVLPKGIRYHHHIITTSTNHDAFTLLQLHQQPVLVTTEYQLTGRGRRGQAWHSPFGANLMFSFGCWLTEQEVFHPYSLQIGLVLASVLKQRLQLPMKLKWPNDLWIESAKCAGILVELQSFQGRTALVVGIGLNVNAVPEGINQPVAALCQYVGGRVDRVPILIDLVAALKHWVEHDFTQPGLDCWAEFDALAGRDIWLLQGNQRIAGRAMGINSMGALIIKTAQGVMEVAGGEISVRLQ